MHVCAVYASMCVQCVGVGVGVGVSAVRVCGGETSAYPAFDASAFSSDVFPLPLPPTNTATHLSSPPPYATRTPTYTHSHLHELPPGAHDRCHPLALKASRDLTQGCELPFICPWRVRWGLVEHS